MGLTIALNRGRILRECLPLLASAGIEPVEDPGASRKLVLPSRAGDHRIVVVRGSDVPTYVEYGAADIGITGKDTLLEYGNSSSFYEMLDLKIAPCKLMTAVREGDSLGSGKIRVASKFNRISRKYFEGQGRQVSMIKLSGAMELAPLLNLADCIVDIVDTGNTLKANGLVALDTIADITSRLIVNRASMKTRFEEVQGLVVALREQVK